MREQCISSVGAVFEHFVCSGYSVCAVCAVYMLFVSSVCAVCELCVSSVYNLCRV